jgi:hypothetical protein
MGSHQVSSSFGISAVIVNQTAEKLRQLRTERAKLKHENELLKRENETEKEKYQLVCNNFDLKFEIEKNNNAAMVKENLDLKFEIERLGKEMDYKVAKALEQNSESFRIQVNADLRKEVRTVRHENDRLNMTIQMLGNCLRLSMHLIRHWIPEFDYMSALNAQRADPEFVIRLQRIIEEGPGCESGMEDPLKFEKIKYEFKPADEAEHKKTLKDAWEKGVEKIKALKGKYQVGWPIMRVPVREEDEEDEKKFSMPLPENIHRLD